MVKRGLSWMVGITCSALSALAIVFLLVYLITGGFSFLQTEEKETFLSCVNNACTKVKGIGVNECSPQGSFCGCIDTDLSDDSTSGMNFFTQGTVRNASSSISDRCLVTGKLLEYMCNGNEILDFEVSCESLGNYICADGECFPDYMESENCRDSDNGLNYLIDGRARNGNIMISDYCTSEGKLAEMYCSLESEEILIDLFDCSVLGNYVCEQGMCVSSL